jgi:hypothetical protein
MPTESKDYRSGKFGNDGKWENNKRNCLPRTIAYPSWSAKQAVEQCSINISSGGHFIASEWIRDNLCRITYGGRSEDRSVCIQKASTTIGLSVLAQITPILLVNISTPRMISEQICDIKIKSPVL